MSSFPFRSTRVTLALVPVAVLWGAVVGFGMGWHGLDRAGEIFRDLLRGRGSGGLALVSFLAFLVTGGVLLLGNIRNRPLHAAKSAFIVGTSNLLAFWALGRLAHENAG